MKVKMDMDLIYFGTGMMLKGALVSMQITDMGSVLSLENIQKVVISVVKEVSMVLVVVSLSIILKAH